MNAFYLSTELTNTKKYGHKTTTYKNGYLYTRYYTTILLSAWFNNFWNIKQYFQPTYLTGINCNKHVFVSHKVNMTLLLPIPDEEKKLSSIFIFTLLCGALKGFRATTKKCENKNLTYFFNSIQLSEIHGTGRDNIYKQKLKLMSRKQM